MVVATVHRAQLSSESCTKNLEDPQSPLKYVAEYWDKQMCEEKKVPKVRERASPKKDKGNDP